MEVDDKEDTNEVATEEATKDENVSKDSDDDDEMDSKNEDILQKLNEKLSTSPYDYQSHLDLITQLRKMGELEKLREARTKMAAIFPLTTAIWLEWIEDERKFTEGEADDTRIVEVFEKAVKDYICPDIWFEYVQFAMGWIGTEDGQQKIREIMERALTAVGIHVVSGAMLWDTYREFENTVLMTLQPAPGSVPSTIEQEKINTQIKRLKSVFRRQLMVPLLDMNNTLLEYSRWVSEDLDAGMQKSFEQSLKKLNELQKYEKALLISSPPELSEYQKYIDYEKKCGDPIRVQCIYERAISDHCLDSELWIQYLDYLVRHLKHSNLVLEVHHRSVRNCPWTARLWVLYMIELERKDTPQTEMKTVFEEALAAGFMTAYEYFDLWRTRCEQLRRRLNTGDNDAQGKEELRECFVRATDHLINTVNPAFNSIGDANYTMWTYYAKCEASCLGDKEKAVKVLEVLFADMPIARKKYLIWLEYYNIERLYGGDDKLEQCRSILRRAVQNCGIVPDDGVTGKSDAEKACETLMDFEREFGTLDDYDESLKRVDAKLFRIKKRWDQLESAAAQSARDRNQNRNKKKTNARDAGRKRKYPEDTSNARGEQNSSYEKFSKRPRQAEGGQSPRRDGFKAPTGLPARYSKTTASPTRTAATSEALTTSTPPPGFKSPPPPGFKPAPDASMDSNNNPNQGQIKDRPGSSLEESKRTVFISNLDFKTPNVEEKLRSIFCDCGKIVEVRIAKSNTGKFRGFCFMLFEDDVAAQKALLLDRQAIDNRPMYVSPHVDKNKNPDSKIFRYNTGMEKHKLFISNVSLNTTRETLEKEFSPHGKLTNVRIVTNRSGKPKGIAYVEYENQSDASQAVMKMDMKEIDGSTIEVAISNPPSRRQDKDQKDRFLGGRGRGRTQLSNFRSSARKPGDMENGTNPDEAEPSTSSGGLSNKDFAAMLLKK